MYCRSPDCDSCNPEQYCEDHAYYYRDFCRECEEEEEQLRQEAEETVHDFDPSGEEHPPECLCPCCDLDEDEEQVAFTEYLDNLPALLPHWAEAEVPHGDWPVYSQLCTKHGGRIGNAVIVALLERDEDDPEDKDYYRVLTDFGTVFNFSLAELEELFHFPVYTMQADRVRKRWKHMQEYVE